MIYDKHSGLPLEVTAAQAALEKMRAREGLRSARLRSLPSRQARGLIELRSVRLLASRQGKDPVTAAIDLACRCIAQELSDSNAIIADAIFSTEIFREEYLGAGVPERVVNRLYASNLMVRRRALLESWKVLHAARGVPTVQAPSERSLRGQLETDTIVELARSIWRTRPEQFDRTVRSLADEGSAGRPGKVVVIGGAVMDVSFRVRSIPQPNGAEEAVSCELSPGGKGVTQAVAAARLGLDAILVAAVGDGAFGAQIIDFLITEGVDTSHIKVMGDARTPMTAVINPQMGGTAAINWRNKHRVRLEKRDIERVREEMSACDVVMLTFEPPTSVVDYALTHCLGALEERPITILSTAPPYLDHSIGGQALTHIDYLVAQLGEIPSFLSNYGDSTLTEELSEFTEGADLHAALERIAGRLLDLGIGTLCVPINGACAIYGGTAGNFQLPSFLRSFRLDSAGARDAFCAAMAAQLWCAPEGFSLEEAALWATAAMAAASADLGVVRSMPRRRQIEATLKRTPIVLASQQRSARLDSAALGEESSA